MSSWKDMKNVHIAGIGGAGCAALAGWLNAEGLNVSGCDLKINERANRLQKEGVKICAGHGPAHLEGRDWFVHTPALPPDSPELGKAKKMGLKVGNHRDAFGEITKEYRLVAVSGAHGKTTTTMMISTILEKANKDPNYFVGEGLYRHGGGEIFVVEADEYMRGFHAYSPEVAVITNIAYDHPEVYENIEDVTEAFDVFADNIREGGLLIGYANDKETAEVLKHAKSKGTEIYEYRDADIHSYASEKGETKARIKVGDGEVELRLPIPGRHNVLNAIAAIRASMRFGVDPQEAANILAKYKSVRRRFDRFATYKGVPMYSDWAHHPDQIKAVLQALRDIYPEQEPKQKVAVFYEPHQYERTYQLFEGLSSCWEGADALYVLPIYKVAGRETKEALENVSAEKLAKSIENKMGMPTKTLEGYEEMATVVDKAVEEFDVIVFLNAGPLDDYLIKKYC